MTYLTPDEVLQIKEWARANTYLCPSIPVMVTRMMEALTSLRAERDALAAKLAVAERKVRAVEGMPEVLMRDRAEAYND